MLTLRTNRLPRYLGVSVHNVLTISTDSSDYKWGACYQENGKQTQIGDYWDESQKRPTYHAKGSFNIENDLICLGSKLKRQRAHAHVDKMVLVLAERINIQHYRI